MGWFHHVTHAVSHAFHAIEKPVENAVGKVVHIANAPVEKIGEKIGGPVGGLIRHTGEGVEKFEKGVVHTALNPQETVQTSMHGIGNIGRGLDDLVHGNFKQALGEIVGGAKNVIDPAHVNGNLHNLSRPITNPINQNLASGIKKATGHNVLGSHPLNTVAKVAPMFIPGVGQVYAAGESLLMEGLEMAGSYLAEGAGGALAAIGLDSAGAVVEGWGSTLASLAADNAAEVSTAFSNITGHSTSLFSDAAQNNLSGKALSSGESSVHGVGTVGNWSAQNSGSVFNGGINATGVQAGTAQTGSGIGNIANMSVQQGDTAGFGFGQYWNNAASGTAGTTAQVGYGGITPVERSALGSSVTGSSGGYNGLADSVTGRLGGDGISGATAQGTVDHAISSLGAVTEKQAATQLFNNGVNYYAPNQMPDKQSGGHFKMNQAMQDAINPPAQQGGFGEALKKTDFDYGGNMGLLKGMSLKDDSEFLKLGSDYDLNVKQFKGSGDNGLSTDFSPAQLTAF